MPLDRKHEQKLWDAFRKPIDEAFNRKTEEREKAAAALSERDRAVLEASTRPGGGQRHRRRAEDQGRHGGARGGAARAGPGSGGRRGGGTGGGCRQRRRQPRRARARPRRLQRQSRRPHATQRRRRLQTEAAAPAESPAAPAPAPKPAPKPVVAMRGDDRPGMKKAEPQPAGRGGKFGDRKGGPGGKFGERRDDRGPRDARSDGRFGGERFGDRPAEDRGPAPGRCGVPRPARSPGARADDAQEAGRAGARRGVDPAHDRLGAPRRRPAAEPAGTGQVRHVGGSQQPGCRHWEQHPPGDASEALLRLEIAAEVPTPAEQLSARRMLQLQLLTRRNDPSPAQTWGQDTARVLASALRGRPRRGDCRTRSRTCCAARHGRSCPATGRGCANSRFEARAVDEIGFARDGEEFVDRLAP